MALTPEEIEKKTFATALRGYDLDEVDDFLDEVVAAMRELQERIESVERAPEPVASAEIDESAVGRALVAAQATADRILADARQEAERILEEARTEAEEWLEERNTKRVAVEAEMEELSRRVAEVRNQLAVLATTVADRLDEMDEAISSVSADTAESSDGETVEEETHTDVEEFTLPVDEDGEGAETDTSEARPPETD